MCYQCDYVELLEASGLSPLHNRVQVIEVIGNSRAPLTAQEILDALQKSHNINRVTLYRILDLLVHYRLVERMSAGDRSYRYGLGENPNHPSHPHFYCTRCGHMECLEPDSLDLDIGALREATSSEIHRVEVRLDGICRQCLHHSAD
jgi:Fur family ferric uptake transcriptional regulator